MTIAKRRAPMVAAAALAVSALVLSACGSSSGGSETGSNASNAASSGGTSSAEVSGQTGSANGSGGAASSGSSSGSAAAGSSAGAAAGSSTGATAGSSGGSSQNPIKIAMVAPLSGSYAPLGNSNVTGAKAAIKQINSQGGVNGRQITLDVKNGKTDPAESRKLTKQVVGDDDYVAMIGSVFSSAALADEPIASQAKLPFISVAAAGQQVDPIQPYVWVIPPISAIVAKKMGDALAKQGLTKVALLHDNGGFPTEGTKDVKAIADEAGLTITDDIEYSLDTTDFSAQLNKLKNSKADAVWLWSVTQQAVTITKEFKKLGLPQTLVLTHGNPTPEFLKGTCPASNGAIIASTWAQVGNKSISTMKIGDDVKSKDVTEKVNTLLGDSADQFTYDGYTAALFLAKAMEKDGATRDGIAKAFSDSTFVGPEGVYKYTDSDHNGIGPDSIVVEKIKDCKLAALN